MYYTATIYLFGMRNDHDLHLQNREIRDTTQYTKKWRSIFVVKASAHSFKQFTSRLLKLSFSLSMHLYNSDGRHAWFHLHGTSRPDRSLSAATKYKMKNSLSTVGLEPSTFDYKSDALPTELAGLGECCPFKWPYYIHVLPIPMFTLFYVPEWWSRA